MRSRHLAGFIGALALVAVAWAQGGKPATPADPDAVSPDKILVIVTHPRNAADTGGGYYEKCKVKKLGDTPFLVGTVVDVSANRIELVGRTVWTKIADISTITEFESLDALKEALAKRQ